jgi:uncharacterized protein
VNPLLVNVNELLRRPGNTKDIVMSADAGELGVNNPKVAGDAVVSIALHVESLSDGLVVTGSAAVPWHDDCRRCLEPASGIADAQIQELYQERLIHPDAFAIVGDQIDLGPMVRELVLLELPGLVLCRPDCAGLCTVCGTNRNEDRCECDPSVSDPRWSALDGLRDALG